MKILICVLCALLSSARATQVSNAFERCLFAIEEQESSHRDLGVHPDGKSYGRYGVSANAVDFCQKRGYLLDWETNAYGLLVATPLADPSTNAWVARTYFALCLRTSKNRTLREAIGRYHAPFGSRELQEKYICLILARLHPKAMFFHTRGVGWLKAENWLQHAKTCEISTLSHPICTRKIKKETKAHGTVQ